MYNIPTLRAPAEPDMMSLLDELRKQLKKEINVAKIGTIESYDAAKQEVSVQITHKVVTSIKPDGARTLADYPLLLRVPVYYPSGGGFTLTFPISAGDECVVLFNDRQIDDWLNTGDSLPPATGRIHDINDGIAFVGIRSNPNALSSVSTTTTQLRSDDGNTYVEVAGNDIVKVKADTKVLLDTPLLEVTGIIDIQNENSVANACTIDGDISANGDVIGDADNTSISLVNHVHDGVESGASNTGEPVG
ncbi:Gp138 family membrane-puncturing spike protein [uncultured Paraglaciecola sp.]|uniref:Gp138 family membrane-puncturing spike protein n=1 Tax=uncultured Paraglaciecola sp. TaxID=1765024 RepID=UPI00261103FF|nr:Gp138 family membrane-puncturing spike protein [uncultured Paraglaciecola sp.]